MDALLDFLLDGFNMGTVLEAVFILIMAAILAHKGIKKTFKNINESLSKMVDAVDGVKKEMSEVKTSVNELSQAMRSIEQNHETRIKVLEQHIKPREG